MRCARGGSIGSQGGPGSRERSQKQALNGDIHKGAIRPRIMAQFWSYGKGILGQKMGDLYGNPHPFGGFGLNPDPD
jgi:hypothetical protein